MIRSNSKSTVERLVRGRRAPKFLRETTEIPPELKTPEFVDLLTASAKKLFGKHWDEFLGDMMIIAAFRWSAKKIRDLHHLAFWSAIDARRAERERYFSRAQRAGRRNRDDDYAYVPISLDDTYGEGNRALGTNIPDDRPSPWEEVDNRDEIETIRRKAFVQGREIMDAFLTSPGSYREIGESLGMCESRVFQIVKQIRKEAV